MHFNFCQPDRPLIGLLLSTVLSVSVPCNTGPALVSAISTTGADIKLSVSAQGLPPFKRLTLTFTYDPSAMDPLGAIVSSPLTSAGLGAVLDTSAKKLVLNIVATSTITVADGARVSAISAPLLQGGAIENALRLVDALCIDRDGAPIAISISNRPAAVRRDLKQTPLSAAGRPQLPGTAWVLDGRKCPSNRRGAVLIGRGPDGGTLFLSPLRISFR